MSDLAKELRIMAGMIQMCERISFGSDSALMEKAADEIEHLDRMKSELRATMANQQDLIDALEHTEKRIERENEELKAKIAELQNGVLAQSVADLTRQNSGLMAQVEQYQKLFNESPDLTFDTCLAMFHDEIAEVKAKAVDDINDGELFLLIKSNGSKICAYQVQEWLENKANQIRQQFSK